MFHTPALSPLRRAVPSKIQYRCSGRIRGCSILLIYGVSKNRLAIYRFLRLLRIFASPTRCGSCFATITLSAKLNSFTADTLRLWKRPCGTGKRTVCLRIDSFCRSALSICLNTLHTALQPVGLNGGTSVFSPAFPKGCSMPTLTSLQPTIVRHARGGWILIHVRRNAPTTPQLSPLL